MKGKTARLIVTMGTTKWYYFLINRHAGVNTVKIGVLKFCGIKSVKITVISGNKSSKENKRKKMVGRSWRIRRKSKIIVTAIMYAKNKF